MSQSNWSQLLKDPSLVCHSALLDGQWQQAVNGAVIQVRNPTNGQPIGSVPNMGEKETLLAIEFASRAQGDWSTRSSHDRANILQKFFTLIIENLDDLAWIITREQGKPLRESKAEVHYAASFVQWFAEQGKRVQGELLSSPFVDKRMMVMRQPIGVCAAITPWNFPAAMITRKVAPALAAGCTMIVKPSELTPLTALALGVLSLRAGVPAGVLQIVTGEPTEIGKALTHSTVVRKLSFTGSTRVGKLLAGQSAGTLKRVSLELGGLAPFIVLHDADIDSAVAGAIASKYRNSGQTCICTNRFLVHQSVYAEFTQKLSLATQKLQVGPGDDPMNDLGPLINTQAVEKVQRHISDALVKGAELLQGGHPHLLGGNFFQPTVLGRVSPDMLVAQEETFGPVSAIMCFDDVAEAIQLSNATDYGLAAYLYGRDISQVWRVAEALEYGMVGINTGSISTEVAPFGGIKQSGYGREGSQLGIDEYLNVKYVCLGL